MSTVAFAKEFDSVVTLEHQDEWIRNIVEVLPDKYVKKLTLYKIPDDDLVYPSLPPQTDFDFVFIDGRRRGMCIETVMKYKLAPFFVVHDMQRNESGSIHALRKMPYYGKVADDCGIAFFEEPTGELKKLIEEYDYRDILAPSIPWHPSHEDLLYRDWCGLRASYNLDS